MPVFLITYDLIQETKRPPIVDSIKEIGDWAKLSESSYAVSTHLSDEQIYARLQQFIDSNDRLYIIALKKPWSGFGLVDVNRWLDERLTY